MPQAVLEEDIVAYYDDCHVDYQIVWHVNSRMAMHYGYWDESTPNLRSALDNMNKKVAKAAGIRPGDRVLDAGCGVGGSSFFLASRFDCQVEGITLSSKQVDTARSNAAKLGLQDQTKFSVGNYTSTNFPDNYFDVVWAIESVCHASEKKDFLAEAYRILKSGGRLIVADFFQTDRPPAGDDMKWMDKWAHSWAIPGFESLQDFLHKAVKVGFSDVSAKDITAPITPSAKRLYYCWVPGIICDGFLRLFGRRSGANKKNVWSCLYQYKALKADLWSYQLVCALKTG